MQPSIYLSICISDFMGFGQQHHTSQCLGLRFHTRPAILPRPFVQTTPYTSFYIGQILPNGGRQTRFLQRFVGRVRRRVKV